jgi:hypothetical protein
MPAASIGGYNFNFMSLFQQRYQDLTQRANAVQSGDLRSGQQTLTVVTQSAQTVSMSGASISSADTYTGAASGTSPRDAFLAMIGAVQSGDISSAQDALTALQNGGSPQDTGNSGAGDSPLLQDIAALLIEALQGDISGMQSAAKAVRNDLQPDGEASSAPLSISVSISSPLPASQTLYTSWAIIETSGDSESISI